MAISLNTVNSEVVRAHKRIDGLDLNLKIKSLWTGSNTGGTTTITGLSNYSLIIAVLRFYSASTLQQSIVCAKNLNSYYYECSDPSRDNSGIISFSNNTITHTSSRYDSTRPILVAVYGIM